MYIRWAKKEEYFRLQAGQVELSCLLVIINSHYKRFIMQLTVINRGESDGAEQPCSHADGGHLRFPRCKFHLT